MKPRRPKLPGRNDPHRCERLEHELSGETLVELRNVLDDDAALDVRFQQPRHRRWASPLSQRDNDAVRTQLVDDGWQTAQMPAKQVAGGMVRRERHIIEHANDDATATR